MRFLLLIILFLPAFTTRGQVFDSLYAQCTALYNSADYEGAANCFEEAQSANGITKEGKYEFILLTGMSQMKAGLTESAKKSFQKILKEKHGQPAAYYYLAAIYLEEERTKDAIELLETGMEVFPDNQEIVLTLANIYIEEEDEKALLQTLETAIHNDSTNAILYYTRGVALDRGIQDDEVEASYQKAIELDPEYLDAHFNLGAYYFNIAVDMVEASYSTSDIRAAEEMDKEAVEYFKRALPYFEKADEIQPGDPEVTRVLDDIYLQLEARE